MLSTVSYLFWKCLFFPGSDLSKKVINRSLNGVSNTQGKPINITVIEPTMMSVNQCAPIITLGNDKNHKNNKGDKTCNFAEITPHECRKNKQHHAVIAGKAIS